jgi:hypothetical protein
MKEFMLPQNKSYLDSLSAKMVSKKTELMSKFSVSEEDFNTAVIASGHRKTASEAALAAAVEFRIYMNILSNSVALENWEYVPLQVGEWPEFVNYYDKKVQVRTLSPGGGNFNDYISDPTSISKYSTDRLSTDWLEVPYKNNLSNKLAYSERVEAMIADAMTIKIDTLARTAEEAGYGALTAGTHYVLNDSRKTNMPATTEVSATSEGAITIGLMKKILQHFLDLNKRVRKIEFNPSHASELWDWSTVVSGVSSVELQLSKNTVPQYIQDEIYKTGTINNIFGYNVQFVPVDTIATKYVRVFTDEPVGYFFDVPGEATNDYRDEATVSMITGKEKIEMYRATRQILFVQPAFYRLNYARFQFDS